MEIHRIMNKLIVLSLECIVLVIVFLLLPTTNYQRIYIHADSVTDNALNFLKSKQDSSGKITTGFSAPSQWSTIAFAINGIDVATVKSSEKSLRDFLLTDIPSEPSSATDFENRILAIVAQGDDPTNFGGMNYVQKLESFYNNGQIGDTCSLNDDIFGLLSLIASGNTSTPQVKQDTLNFLIQKQDPQDGGFGFSAPGCEWYSTASDMTAAAIQSLQAAKENGLTNPSLDDAIEKAKNYLLTNQVSDGGFGYFGASDSDTTGWVLMAFNSLGLKDSEEAIKSKNWLLTQQSAQDGGFQAFDYGTNSMVSNSTTTAQSLIALSGKGWVIRIFTPNSATVSPSPIPTPTSSPVSTVSPTPTPTPNSSTTSSHTPTPNPQPSVTPVPTISPIPTPTPVVNTQSKTSIVVIPTPSSTAKVLGATTTTLNPKERKPLTSTNELKNTAFTMIGVFGLFTTFKFLEGRRWKR